MKRSEWPKQGEGRIHFPTRMNRDSRVSENVPEHVVHLQPFRYLPEWIPMAVGQSRGTGPEIDPD